MSTATKAEPPLAAAQKATAEHAPDVIMASPSLDPIRIDPDARLPGEKIPTRRYWVGVLLSAPIESCSRGGVSFSKRVGKIEYEIDGSIRNPDAVRLGDVVELTEAQKKVALQRIASTVVRTIRNPEGRPTQVQFIATKWIDASGAWVPDYRHDPMPGDVPLGAYIYMVPVAEGAHVPREYGAPLPLPLVR